MMPAGAAYLHLAMLAALSVAVSCGNDNTVATVSAETAVETTISTSSEPHTPSDESVELPGVFNISAMREGGIDLTLLNRDRLMLDFDASSMSLEGHGGCSKFAAEFSIDSGALQIANLVHFLAACGDESSNVQQTFVTSFLQQSPTIRATPEGVRLTTDDAEIVLVRS